MINSMTGFGRSTRRKAPWEVFAEVSAVNSRFLDLHLHLPRELYFYQQEIRELIKQEVARGKLTVYLSVTREESGGLGSLRPDQVKALLEEAGQVARKHGLENDLRLSHLPSFNNLMSEGRKNRENPELWKLVQAVLKQALREFQEMRRAEGRELLADFRKRLQSLEKHLQLVGSSFKSNRNAIRDTILAKVAKLEERHSLTSDRIDMEVALLADKLDINEELTRLRSHIKLFRATLREQNPVGKKLNFLLQEMNREGNTIASKSSSAGISHQVVYIKEELECLREQVQNLE